jgi:hypothetical protein
MFFTQFRDAAPQRLRWKLLYPQRNFATLRLNGCAGNCSTLNAISRRCASTAALEIALAVAFISGLYVSVNVNY